MAVLISDRMLDGEDRPLAGESDEHLVTLARQGHGPAFAAIVMRYRPELEAQARRLTSMGRSEDAVQQALLNALVALQSGTEVRHLRGWLHQILRNVIASARVSADAPLEEYVSCGEPLEETVARRDRAHATLAELSALPERQREALVGTAVLGFSRAHVARAMGVSEGAVRQLVHRARLRLREAVPALIPLPLARLLGTARSGLGAAPDASLGAATAASGGVAIKVGAVVASGILATGLAVTHATRAHHRGGVRRHPAAQRIHQAASTAAVAPVLAARLSGTWAPVSAGEHGSAPAGRRARSSGGSGRSSLAGTGEHRGQDGRRSGSGPSRDGGGRGSERSSGDETRAGSVTSGSRRDAGESTTSGDGGRTGSGRASSGGDGGRSVPGSGARTGDGATGDGRTGETPTGDGRTGEGASGDGRAGSSQDGGPLPSGHEWVRAGSGGDATTSDVGSSSASAPTSADPSPGDSSGSRDLFGTRGSSSS